MASSLATRNYNGGSSQGRVVGASGAGCERAGRDGGVCGHRLGLGVGATICQHWGHENFGYEHTL